MSQLGSRLFFLVMLTGQQTTASDLLAHRGISYRERHAKCRIGVGAFLKHQFEVHGGVRAVKWDSEADPAEVREWIARCSMLLAAMRREVLEERDWTSGSREILYRAGEPEAPQRAFAVLTNVACGHALVHGRTQLSVDDLPLIARVTVSTMPGSTGRIFQALVSHQGEMSVAEVQEALGSKHRQTARTQMERLDALGVTEFRKAGKGKAARICFRPEWKWCASPEFRALSSGNLSKI
jgi:hypothetical protein